MAKLKTMYEQGARGMQGRNFQDMSEDERAKMREEFTRRNEEQQKIFAAAIEERYGVKVVIPKRGDSFDLN